MNLFFNQSFLLNLLSIELVQQMSKGETSTHQPCKTYSGTRPTADEEHAKSTTSNPYP